MKRSFESYIEDILILSEILEVPGVKDNRARLIKEVWELYPTECKNLGLRDNA